MLRDFERTRQPPDYPRGNGGFPPRKGFAHAQFRPEVKTQVSYVRALEFYSLVKLPIDIAVMSSGRPPSIALVNKSPKLTAFDFHSIPFGPQKSGEERSLISPVLQTVHQRSSGVTRARSRPRRVPRSATCLGQAVQGFPHRGARIQPNFFSNDCSSKVGSAGANWKADHGSSLSGLFKDQSAALINHRPNQFQSVLCFF